MAVTGTVGQAECMTWAYAILAIILQLGAYTLLLIGLVEGEYFSGGAVLEAA